MMKKVFSFGLILLCISSFAQEKPAQTVQSEVNEATVFINGAQVVRKKAVDIVEGKSVVKFTGLSPYLDAKSIQVKVDNQVVVLSVNHQFNYTDSASISSQIKELRSKSETIENQLKVESAKLEVISEELAFMKDNHVIGGKDKEVTFLNLKQTSDFYAERISALKMRELEVRQKIESLNTDYEKLQNEIGQLGSNRKDPVSEIVVNVEAKAAARCKFEVSYFVNNAGWIPSYDIRVNNIAEPVDLVYKANIHQNTKEEWKNVKLRLSSSNPNLGSVAPQLQTYYLNYNTPAPRYVSANNQVSGRVFDSNTNEPLAGASVIIQGSTIGTIADANGYYSLSLPNSNSLLQVSSIGYETQTLAVSSVVMNIALNPDAQTLNDVVVIGYGAQVESDVTEAMAAPARKETKLRKSSLNYVASEVVENKTAFEFDIKTPYTISSDNKNNTVNIDSYSLNADYVYYCVPKVDKDAFLMANIIDWEQYNLLEGEANIFFENTFVGKSVLDVRFIADTLHISLGRDKNVSVKRDKIKDYTSRQFLGSKKEESKAWQITVRNNKSQKINMILFDQVPVSSLEEIEVAVDELSGAFWNKDNGEVKWKFSLEPSENKVFNLKYKVKYPKDRNLIIE
jgi:prefoldin subunit 5